MIEKEMAGIIRFVLDAADDPAAYYWKVPEDFEVPAAFFPPPEIVTGPDTLNSYSMDYAWYIKLFAASDEAAYVLARKAAEKVRMQRNLIPLYDAEGSALDKPWVRVKDPSIKMLDSGACQLRIEWTSRRPYAVREADEGSEKMQEFEVNGWNNPDVYTTVTVAAAFEAAVTEVTMDYPHPDYAGEYPDS